MLIRLGEGAESDRSDLERGNERVCPYKSGGVVVLDGLCVAEGLQDGVGLQQLLLQLALGHTQERHNNPAQPARSVTPFISALIGGNCTSNSPNAVAISEAARRLLEDKLTNDSQ